MYLLKLNDKLNCQVSTIFINPCSENDFVMFIFEGNSKKSKKRAVIWGPYQWISSMFQHCVMPEMWQEHIWI
jgi:hypothetical protein